MRVITISRQYGSGGRKIGTQVAERLGYRFFDKNLMVQIASDVGLSENEIVDYSEENHHVKSFMQRLGRILGRKDVVATVATRTRDTAGREVELVRTLDETAAVDLVRAAVRAAYERGNVVIVGRGGQIILRDMPDVLHVRVIAPLVTRRNRLGRYEDVSYAEAEQVALERDKANQDYIRRFYDADLDDLNLYHMVINTGKWNTDEAAQLILNAVQQRQESVAAPLS